MENKSYTNCINTLYIDKSIIIGLTGRTGSGCSTTAKLLASNNYKELEISNLDKNNFLTRRKLEICQKYLSKNWKKFNIIKVSNVIMDFVFSMDFSCLEKYLKKILNGEVEGELGYLQINDYNKFIEKIKGICNEAINKRKHINKMIARGTGYKSEEKKYYFEELDTFSSRLKEIMKGYDITIRRNNVTTKSNCYYYLLQQFGNNIRSSGSPFSSEFTGKHFYEIAKKIKYIIDLSLEIEQSNSLRICIDAIRNPYEAMYLKDNCTNFYLVAINASEDERAKRLNDVMIKKSFNSLNLIECPQKNKTASELFYHQNIKKCLELTDIHFLNNDNRENLIQLKSQIIKYVALMLHPGLISPTDVERCMQIAYNARVNSGCLSRKVGAVITDENYIVKSIGWNAVPENQTPCNMRCIDDFKNSGQQYFSKFEFYDESFRKQISKIDKEIEKNIKKEDLAIYCSYCFKDVYNGITKMNN